MSIPWRSLWMHTQFNALCSLCFDQLSEMSQDPIGKKRSTIRICGIICKPRNYDAYNSSQHPEGR